MPSRLQTTPDAHAFSHPAVTTPPSRAVGFTSARSAQLDIASRPIGHSYKGRSQLRQVDGQ